MAISNPVHRVPRLFEALRMYAAVSWSSSIKRHFMMSVIPFDGPDVL